MYPTPLFIPAGSIEVAIIFLLITLLFGASKIPKLARSIGKAQIEWRRGREESKDE